MFESDTSDFHERRIVRCKYCRTLVIWFSTASGKRIAVDADTVEAEDTELDLDRHISHHGDCPGQKQ